jgi:hypothetical protein
MDISAHYARRSCRCAACARVLRSTSCERVCRARVPLGCDGRDDYFVTRYREIEVALRGLGAGQQAALAVDLASLAEPFAQISPHGQPAGGLAAVADAIRNATDRFEVDQARHVLWSTPELRGDEPEDASWFSLSATVAWIYASDSKSTAPSDGVVNAFKRVCELLDAVDNTLGDTNFVDRLLDAVEAAIEARPVSLSPDVVPNVGSVVDRLMPL